MIDEKQPSYYAIIPSTVRYDENLKFAERLLYGEITALIGKEGYCYASNSYFAKLYGVIPGTISRYISHLNKLGYIKVELIKNEYKEITERRIYITDISCKKILTNTYEQNCLYPEQKSLIPISKSAQYINIDYQRMDRLFKYLIYKGGQLPEEFVNEQNYLEFYEIIKRLEFDYTEEMINSFQDNNIEKIKVIIYCLKDIFIKNKRDILAKASREKLIEVYDCCKKYEEEFKNTNKEIKDFYNYYYSSVLRKLKS